MRLSKKAIALGALLVVNLVLVQLLSPLGFEDRPPTDLKMGGYIAIGTIFAGVILDLAAIVLLFRRARLASRVAIVGSILFFVPIVGDQAGLFFSLPIPPMINTLEYIFVAVLLVTLLVAWWVHRESSPADEARIDTT